MNELDDILDSFGDTSNIAKQLGQYVEEQLQSLLVDKFNSSGLQGTGRLKDSIRVQYDSDASVLTIAMNYYGIYQNYGVLGYEGFDRGTRDVEAFWGIQPSSGSRFKFSKGAPGWRGMRQYGLMARPFIPSEEDLNTIVQDFIDQFQTLQGND